MITPDALAPTTEPETIPAGVLAPWRVGELVAAPVWRGQWHALLGPGILLAGSSIGAGEWLFGPAVTAQYGGTLLWLATLSIVFQVFYNLEVMRYALYCGEPIFTGFFRTWPGPKVWTLIYLTLFIAHVFPFMASNAAVPLAAALLGHLPGDADVSLMGITLSEVAMVKALGYVVFVVAFVPLVFGGKVYTMLERLMTFKIIVILSFLVIVCLTMATRRDAAEIVSGFFRFGSVALRAETVVDGPHFSLSEREGTTRFIIMGTMERGSPLVTSFVVRRPGSVEKYGVGAVVPAEIAGVRSRLLERAVALSQPGRFFLESDEPDDVLKVRGRVGPGRTWIPDELTVVGSGGARRYDRLEKVPEPHRSHARELLANEGFVRVSLGRYWWKHGRFPELDWALLAAFAAIAGSGGLSNALFSNYARDKGWGMGSKTGAIPSAVGGRTIGLSHVGIVFPINSENLNRWRSWFRHILRDQLAVWMVCSFIGLALPCMLSLAFIRNAPIAENRVAAMTAEGIAGRFPTYAHVLWFITLFCGFLALAPNAVLTGDLIARQWTDLLWTSRAVSRRLEGNQVKYIYYAILSAFAVWGLLALTLFQPLQIAKIGAVLGNVALAFSAFHTLYVNCTLLPPALRPNRLMRAGLVCCGVFFLTVTAFVFLG